MCRSPLTPARRVPARAVCRAGSAARRSPLARTARVVRLERMHPDRTRPERIRRSRGTPGWCPRLRWFERAAGQSRCPRRVDGSRSAVRADDPRVVASPELELRLPLAAAAREQAAREWAERVSAGQVQAAAARELRRLQLRALRPAPKAPRAVVGAASHSIGMYRTAACVAASAPHPRRRSPSARVASARCAARPTAWSAANVASTRRTTHKTAAAALRRVRPDSAAWREHARRRRPAKAA